MYTQQSLFTKNEMKILNKSVSWNLSKMFVILTFKYLPMFFVATRDHLYTK